MSEELQMAVERFSRLQLAEADLRSALPRVAGLPTAETAVRTALRVVARQAGKALVKVQRLEAAELDAEDEEEERACR